MATEHPRGDRASSLYKTPNAQLFPGRYGRAERLPSVDPTDSATATRLIRNEIEPVRPWAIDSDARLNRAGEPDKRYCRPDPQAPAIRCAPSYGYKWSVPVNLASLAKPLQHRA